MGAVPVGDRCIADLNMDGDIDEVRVASTARSADWIKAQHLSMTDAFIKWKLKIISWQEVDPNQ